MSGYIIGILLSFLFVKFDKKKLIRTIQVLLRRKLRNPYIYELSMLCYIFLIAGVVTLVGEGFNLLINPSPISFIKNLNFYNIFTVLFLLDFSRTESLTLSCSGKDNYNSAVKSIARSITLGFVAPLVYICVLGNFAALVLCSIFSLKAKRTVLIRSLYRLFSLVPSLLTLGFIYILLLFSKRSSYLSFKDMFFTNLYLDPMLNIYICTACLADTYMLIDYQDIFDNRVIKYGSNRNIEKFALHRILAQSYIICSIAFLLFAVINI